MSAGHRSSHAQRAGDVKRPREEAPGRERFVVTHPPAKAGQDWRQPSSSWGRAWNRLSLTGLIRTQHCRTLVSDFWPPVL